MNITSQENAAAVFEAACQQQPMFRFADAAYFGQLLRALQEEAYFNGYVFHRTGREEDIPDSITDLLVAALSRARLRCKMPKLNPYEFERYVQQDVKTKMPRELLAIILSDLARRGMRPVQVSLRTRTMAFLKACG